jgi:hypothetical protein
MPHERDPFDVTAVAIEELLCDFRCVSLYPSESLQRLKRDATVNFHDTVMYREVDGAPYSVRNATDRRNVMHHRRSLSRGCRARLGGTETQGTAERVRTRDRNL